MKRILFLFFIVLFPLKGISQNEFITVWDLSKNGALPDQISFNVTTATNAAINYNWSAANGANGSGTIPANSTTATITGLPAGQKVTLSLEPTNLKAFAINNGADRARLINVTQWGQTIWSSMKNAFMGSANLNITATDIPDLSNVTDMSGMFQNCPVLNGPANIGSWNTATVQNMQELFALAKYFNRDISNWNTSSVTNMNSMFYYAWAFNQNIGNWDTSKVTDMNSMFYYAYAFNKNIGNWNTSSVTDMSSMFYNAWIFNQPIGGWNTSSVTNMMSMFYYAIAFNSSIGNWNTAKVINMERMFSNARLFNQDINSWNTNQVKNMRFVFSGATVFNQNISNWDTAKVTDMSNMFQSATAFNQDISNWNTANITNMSFMFSEAAAFNQNIGTWKLNPAVNMRNMLDNSGMDCQNYSATLQEWADTSLGTGHYLGAAGRQYGTNATATRTFLTDTKGWTITGDSPSGQACGLSQTITATDMVKTYGDLPFVPNATASSGLEASYLSADNSIAEAFQDTADGNKWKIRIHKAGEVSITAKQPGNGRYIPASDVTFNLTINKAELTVTADALGKIYGSEDPALTYTITGLTNGDDQTVITGALTRTAGEAVGTYAIEQGTLAAANYDITYTGADLTITKATLKIAADAKSKAYGAADPTLTYTVTGLVNGDTESILTGALSRGAGEAVGTYAIEQGTLATTANYNITYTGADFTIIKAALNIVADAKSKAYGAADPALTYTVTGLVNGDTESILTGALSRVAGEAVGTYAIGQGTLATTANYNITYTGADFTITKATLNIVADAKSKAYGAADPALTYTVTGLTNGDDESVLTGILIRTLGEAPGTYPIGQGTLAAANYTITYTGADLTITKAALNIVADAKSKVFGAADPALTYTVTGFVNGDDQTVITGALSRVAGEAVGTYAIEQGTLAAANYTITYTGADLTITKAALNIVADAKSKVFGAADPALTYTVTGFVNGDDQTVITGALSRVAGEAVGTYAIEQGTLAAANYTITYTGADLTITKAALNIVGDDKSKVFGAADPALTYTVTGLANGDDQTVITGALTRVAGEAVGTYAIVQGTLTAANYTITYTGADLTITKAALNIAADAKSKVFGAADPALTYTVTGLANGDTESILTGALTRVAGEAVGTYAIEQGTLAAANYDITYTGADLTITKAALKIVADAKSKVFGAADPALTYTVTGFVNGDTESILTGALSRVAGEAVGTYAIEQGTLAANANYTITYTGADFTITKAALNIAADAKSKVFGAADPALTYTVTGLANGDTESILTGALSRVAGENIGLYAIELGTLAATNYDITYTGANLTITKATLNIVADAKSKIFGAADPALTYTVSGFLNGDDRTVLTGALTRVAGENIGLYAIELGTLAAANYTITYTGADLTITKAALNIVADAKSKIFGAADPALTYTVSGFLNEDDRTVLTGALTRVAGENIGLYAIELGTLAAANYTITYTGADLTITKAALNIVGDDKSKVYGTTDPALTYTVTGFVNGDDQTVITGALTRVAGEAVGTYAIGQGTLAAANYDITYTGADLTITKAALKIVADAKSKVFGAADPALTYTVTGFVNGDDQTVITGALTRVAGEAVGTYAIEQGTLTAANYTITYTGADFNITKAALNIAADAKSKVFGAADPALTYTVTGFVNGDDQTVITGALTRVAGENIGTYAIEQGTLAAANYTITYTGADFNITKAALNIAADAKSKVFGAADPALTYTVSGFVNGDDQAVLTGALTRVAGEAVGTYAIEQGTLTAANYTITYTGADFNITKAALNIAADAKSKVFGAADPALTYTVTGFVNGDDRTVLTGALTRVAGENIGLYAIELGTLAAANYTITYTGADLTITKAALNIVGDDKSKVYGTTDPALTYTVTGFVNGDDQTVITGALTRVAGEAVGTYAIGQGTLTAANYNITYTVADFTITKAALNIVADAKSKVFGAADPALTYTATGFVNGDDQTVITGALTRVAGEAVGTYAIEQGTLTAANYTITYTGADFNITKAALNIAADAKSKVFGAADPALTYTVTGFVNGDDQTVITGALTRVAGENIGTYAIEQGTLAAANYTITYTGADFNITKAALNIAADAKSKVFGAADPALTYTVSGFVNGDDQAVLTGALTRVAGEAVGTYAIEQGTLATTANYNITYTGADFTIYNLLMISSSAQTNITCNGGNDGSASVEVSGGTPEYTYQWSPSGGTESEASGLTSGLYTVTVTDASGTIIIQEFNITQPPVVIPPAAESIQLLCSSGNTTLADLEIEGTNIKWYATAETTTELAPATVLVNNTTYYASQTVNGCESPQRVAITVSIHTIGIPEVDPYILCASATVADLFIAAPSGISYKWYTDESGGIELTEDTLLVTGTYYVEKTEGNCVSQRAAVQVSILELPESPTGAANQSFTVNDLNDVTIADLVMDQENIIWYISLEDARTGNNPLVAEMPLQHEQTYYAVIQNANGCSSLPTTVTVDITLSTNGFDKSGLKYYPNPTTDVLYIEHTNSIDRVTVYNLLGQKVLTQEANGKEVQLNMSALANGNYMIEIRSKKQTQFVKVVKK